MNWKRFTIGTVVLVLILFVLNLGMTLKTNELRTQNLEHSEFIDQQAHIISHQNAIIKNYENSLNRRFEESFSRLEAIAFVEWCITCHEYYYAPENCNKSTGFPAFHREVNQKYEKLLAFLIGEDFEEVVSK